MKLISIFILIILSATSHSRVQPEEGLWDDPNNQGRGITIELQNGVLVATYFGYDQDGNGQWWQGVGFENPVGTWSGTFNAFRDGQCVGCSPQFPVVDESNVIGDFSITFLESGIAQFNWADGSEIIRKNRYGHGQPLNFAIGAWTFNGFTVNENDDYGVTVNNVVFRMDEIVEIDGEFYVIGNYSGFVGSNNFPVLAKYIGEYNFPDGTVLSNGSLVSFVYQTNLAGTIFMRFDMIINENKAEGVMAVFDLNNIPPPAGTNYDGFLRASGARLIDQYEKEALFPVPLNKDSENFETLKLMTTMFPELKKR